MGFDLLDIVDPLHLRNLASAHGAGKKYRVRISSKWLAPSWTLPIWDAAYDLLVKAGSGVAEAKKELDAIKLAAHAGNAQAVVVKTNLDAVSQLIIKGLSRPSAFVAARQRTSPLLPGGRRVAPAVSRQTSTKQAALIKKQAEEIKEMKHAQFEKARRGRLMKQAQLRVEEIRAELEMLQRQLERRDLADEVRTKLEAQAEQYEAQIEALERPAAERASATPVTEATIAEKQEAEKDDNAGAYDSGAPGDVEFSDAGT